MIWMFHNFFLNLNKKAGYSFDSTSNILTIQPGTLQYVANRKYQISVQTSYLGNVYFQNVIFDMVNVNTVPLLTLG